MKRTCLAACLVVGSALAQQTGPSFEVATVKPAAPNQSGYGINWGGGMVRLNNVTLRAAILYAYDLHDYQLSGGPKWVESVAFDITGKADSHQNSQQALHAMLQALLAERFQLRMSKGTKPLPAYALVVAKGGLKLEKSTENGGTSWGSAMMTAKGRPMSDIVNLIASRVGRPVIDRTETEGTFNLKMHFAPDNAAPDSGEPSFFTALQEQCGLKLDATTAPGDVYVIERAEKPSEN